MSALPAVELESDKPILRPVGQRHLRNKMRERDTTVTALAKELGISRKHLSNVLNGHAPLIDPLLHRLCGPWWSRPPSSCASWIAACAWSRSRTAS
jgi:Cro/C1-type HTH DNA-binding domain